MKRSRSPKKPKPKRSGHEQQVRRPPARRAQHLAVELLTFVAPFADAMAAASIASNRPRAGLLDGLSRQATCRPAKKRSARGAEALHEHAQARSHAGMYDRELLARLSGYRSPYGMQHGSERQLLGRLLGPATMNTSGARRPACSGHVSWFHNLRNDTTGSFGGSAKTEPVDGY